MKRCFVYLALSLVSFGAFSQETKKLSIIPLPVSMQMGQGSFTIQSNTEIQILEGQPGLRLIAEQLSKKISRATGFNTKITDVKNFGNNAIRLELSKGGLNGNEGYSLTVTPENISITGDSAAGVFYGVQTLLQIMPHQIESKKAVDSVTWTVPAVAIKDKPRFGWRGTMLDVSRHFFDKQQVKDFIDEMVKYKFNMLHLHLTDDQGWRLEIKSLPRLTEVGAWRPERLGKWGNTPRPSPNEPKKYGGFYTHDDIRELVKYAAERFVNIIPEVDVPGHSLATVASYPELSCTDSNYYVSVGDKIMNWHSRGFSALIDNTLCPANEKVYAFLDKVFAEIAELFPFEYIHMGGDECAKDFWVNNPKIKALMQKEGLKDMHEVQSYFVKRVEKILRSKGKKLIGWDEILEGGLPADATVMSWRGMRGGIKAAQMGHKVVMSPSTHAYVDLYQGDPIAEPPTYGMVRLADSYKFDPVPQGIDARLILGGQANLWTEQIQNMRHAQYMLYPRILAVAESVWTPKENKNWNDFISRLESQFPRLDAAQVKYATTMYDPIFKASREKDRIKLELSTEVEGLDIHYSYDGSNPDQYYPKYTKALIVPHDAADVKVVTYRNGKQAGKQINMPVAELQKRAGKK
jgi:hexosaminidase